MAITHFRAPKTRGTFDHRMCNVALVDFVFCKNLLEMHVAPGTRNLLPFWVFFGYKTSLGRGRPGD